MPYSELDFEKIHPIGRNVLIRKCGNFDDLGNGERGIKLDNGKVLHVPTDAACRTNWVEIIEVGDGCQFYTKDMGARARPEGQYGAITICVESSGSLTCVDYDMFEYWIATEVDKTGAPVLLPLVLEDA